MSEKRISRKTIVLVVTVIVLLLGICFTTVALYAKHELNKPKFTLPEPEPLPSATALPSDMNEAFAYVSGLYDQACAADDAEGSWSTSVDLGGDMTLPFSDADNAIVGYIRDHAAGQIQSFYPSGTDVRMTEAQDAPQLPLQAENVTGLICAEQGKPQDDGTIADDDRYFFTFSFDPAIEDTSAMTDSEVFGKIAQELSPAAALSDTEIKAQSVTADFVVDRINDKLLSAEITRTYTVTAHMQLTDEYGALLDSREGDVTLPYKTTQKISFRHYGVRFTDRAIAVQPGDMKALPAAVTVNSGATKDDYKLTFTPSAADALTFDEDGVMTVEKLSDDPVTVTMTLEYDGHTYSDTLTVYITELEVKTDEQ